MDTCAADIRHNKGVKRRWHNNSAGGAEAEMALEIADRAYVMETGAVVLSGKCQELMHSSAIKKAYLGG